MFNAMLAPLTSIIVSLLKGYLIKLASKEFANWVFFEIADALVKNTETTQDDRWLEAVRATINGAPLPPQTAEEKAMDAEEIKG